MNIAIIGPESTGKTTLCMDLAKHYSTQWIPEYAREYVEKLKKPYTFTDVEKIAKYQLTQLKTIYINENQFVFFDTDLIITKIWFDVVYHKCPEWIETEIQKKHIQYYLLCNTEIPWEPDPVRENSGEMREKLFEKYKNELDKWQLPYEIVSGTGDIRLNNAIKIIEEKINFK
jgi:NadR type nicotinamide-nucleotide adenylyltransferase